MPTATTRLLAIGDVHLGRVSSRLPQGITADSVRPDAALVQAMRTAVEQGVSAVLLAGDVADAGRDLYHAVGVLEEAMGPVLDAGIAVIAVAGNHDHQVLPRLVRNLPRIKLLGAGGRWDTVTVDGPGGQVRVLGWSFPGQHHRESPAVGLPRVDDALPTIGLLHADLGIADSAYAPVTAAELAAAGDVRWLLGHVHGPTLRTDSDAPGYLGSLVGLDPTETGPHGPWLVTVGSGRIALQHLDHAPLRWENVELDVSDLDDPGDHLYEMVRGRIQELLQARDQGHVGARVTLVGRTRHYAGLDAAIDEMMSEGVTANDAGRVAFVDKIIVRVAPRHDLADLARGDDPPGLLARELLALCDDRADELLDAARARVSDIDTSTNYRDCPGRLPDDAPLKDMLLNEGYLVLDALLAEREAADGTA
jgi:exonuclease SbcD